MYLLRNFNSPFLNQKFYSMPVHQEKKCKMFKNEVESVKCEQKEMEFRKLVVKNHCVYKEQIF